MLLRSSSSPLLNSWIPHSKEPSSSPELEPMPRIPKPRPITLTTSASAPTPFSSLQNDGGSLKSMSRAASETDLRSLAVTKKKLINVNLNGIAVDEEQYADVKATASLDGGWFSNFGLGNETCELSVLVGGGVYGGGGKMGGGGGGGSDGGDGRWGSSDSNSNGKESTDVYYQKMIKADPGNSLLLTNYAKYLKEVRGDLEKAEEYCERSILLNPSDGNVLSMYGDLIWQSHKDATRAEVYFDQAVKATPDDCYVQASYARFLWDSEEETQDDDEVEGEEMIKTTPSPSYFHGVHSPSTPIAAAS